MLVTPILFLIIAIILVIYHYLTTHPQNENKPRIPQIIKEFTSYNTDSRKWLSDKDKLMYADTFSRIKPEELNKFDIKITPELYLEIAHLLKKYGHLYEAALYFSHDGADMLETDGLIQKLIANVTYRNEKQLETIIEKLASSPKLSSSKRVYYYQLLATRSKEENNSNKADEYNLKAFEICYKEKNYVKAVEIYDSLKTKSKLIMHDLKNAHLELAKEYNETNMKQLTAKHYYQAALIYGTENDFIIALDHYLQITQAQADELKNIVELIEYLAVESRNLPTIHSYGLKASEYLMKANRSELGVSLLFTIANQYANKIFNTQIAYYSKQESWNDEFSNSKFWDDIAEYFQKIGSIRLEKEIYKQAADFFIKLASYKWERITLETRVKIFNKAIIYYRKAGHEKQIDKVYEKIRETLEDYESRYDNKKQKLEYWIKAKDYFLDDIHKNKDIKTWIFRIAADYYHVNPYSFEGESGCLLFTMKTELAAYFYKELGEKGLEKIMYTYTATGFERLARFENLREKLKFENYRNSLHYHQKAEDHDGCNRVTKILFEMFKELAAKSYDIQDRIEYLKTGLQYTGYDYSEKTKIYENIADCYRKKAKKFSNNSEIIKIWDEGINLFKNDSGFRNIMLTNAAEYFQKLEPQFSSDKYNNLEIAENFVKQSNSLLYNKVILKALAQDFKTLAQQIEKAQYSIFSIIWKSYGKAAEYFEKAEDFLGAAYCSIYYALFLLKDKYLANPKENGAIVETAINKTKSSYELLKKSNLLPRFAEEFSSFARHYVDLKLYSIAALYYKYEGDSLGERQNKNYSLMKEAYQNAEKNFRNASDNEEADKIAVIISNLKKNA